MTSPHYLKNAFHNNLLISNLNTYAEWYEEIMLIAKETYFRQILSVKKKKSSAITVKIADTITKPTNTLFKDILIYTLKSNSVVFSLLKRVSGSFSMTLIRIMVQRNLKEVRKTLICLWGLKAKFYT